MKMQGFRFLLLCCGLSICLSVLSVFIYHAFSEPSGSFRPLSAQDLPVNYANYVKQATDGHAAPVDFSFAAKVSVGAVVHIKTKTKEKIVDNPAGGRRQRRGGGFPFDDFFDFFDFPQPNQRQVVPEQRASGSGVIISPDGYIVTNFHVVDKADEIKITLSNKRSFDAKVIGKDPSTDLAVLKIDGKGLPFLVYGNSEDVQLGQWVLAIGYPLFLDVTVTAGIVSAKSRSIGINAQQGNANLAVEAFIQTDAAVNRGNSGGALVNAKGELVGINSAIASPTGYYSGYSYAIPANLVKKVVEDIIKFGSVQRAFLGVTYPRDEELPEDLSKKFPHYKPGDGVLVMDVASDGAAKKAGLQSGDIIVKVNGKTVTRGAELIEQIGKFRPGDKVEIVYKRSGKLSTVSVLLRSQAGSYGSLKFAQLGCDFETLSKNKAAEYRVKGGVIVKRINRGIVRSQTRIRPGFIITKVEDRPVLSVEDLQNAIAGAEGRVQLEGFYSNYDGRFFYELNLADQSGANAD